MAAQTTQPDLVERIGSLLTAAREAETYPAADRHLDAAEKLYRDRGGSLDLTDRRFVRADLLAARGRAAATAWRRDPEGRAHLPPIATRALNEATAEYGRIVELCERRLDGLEVRLGHELARRHAKWQELGGLISRANYREAWAHYHLALVTDDADARRRRLTEAVERFRGFTVNGYRNHPIVGRCFLGQALCLQELGRPYAVLELLDDVKASNTPPDLLRRLTYLKMHAAGAYGSHLACEQAAAEYFGSVEPTRRLGDVELAMCIERAKCLAALADPARNPEFHGAFRRRLNAVVERINAHGEPWTAELRRVLGKAEGGSAFAADRRARELFDAGRYDEAADTAREALAADPAGMTPAVRADLTYALAAAEINAARPGRAVDAAAAFADAFPDDPRLGRLGAALLDAAEAARARQPPMPADRYDELLAAIGRAFPDIPEVRWRRAELALRRGRDQQAVDLLKSVGPDSPIHLLALYARAVAAARTAAPADTNAPAHADLDAAAEAIVRFADAADARELTGPQARAARAVTEAAVLIARGYLALPPPAARRASALLNRVGAMGAAADTAADARRLLGLRAALLTAEPGEAAARIEALLDPRLDAARAPADLLSLAADLRDRFHRLADAGRSDDAAPLGDLAASIYRAVLARARRSDATAVPASRVPALRLALAETLLRLGRAGEALDHYRRLASRPGLGRSPAVLRGLALSYERQREYARAERHWATLARGLDEGSNRWAEARYHWYRCLRDRGLRGRAARLLAYFRLQHPRIADPAWRRRFDDLAADLGLDAPSTAPAGHTAESRP